MNNNITKSLCAVLTTSFLLLACNPLGGGAGGKSDSLRIKVPDACANPQQQFTLSMSGINPQHGNDQVDDDAQISARFSHQVEPTSLSGAFSLAVWDAAEESFEAIDFDLAVEQQLVIIKPKEPHLEKQQVYQLKVKSKGTGITMAGCEAGAKTVKLLDQNGELQDELESVFATGIGIEPVTFSFIQSIASLELIGDSNGDGVINSAEKDNTFIRIKLSDEAKEGGLLLIDGEDYSISSADVSKGHIDYTADDGLEIKDGRNRVVVIDSNGMVKEKEFYADLIPPTKPRITHAIGKLGVISNARLNDGDETDDKNPTLQGEAEAGGFVNIYGGNGDLLDDNIAVDENGHWTYRLDLSSSTPDETYTWYAIAFDKAGNKSEESDSFGLTLVEEIEVDSAIKGVTLIGDENNDGVINKEESANLAVEIVLDCDSLTEGSVLSIKLNGKSYDYTLTEDDVDSNNCEPLLLPLPLEGDYDLNDNGNILVVRDPDPGSDSVELNFNSDLSIPPAPTILGADDREGGITGNLYSEEETDELQPVLRGTAEPETVVWVFQDEENVTESAAVPVAADGSWSYTPDRLQAGEVYEWRATATSKTLNTSEKGDAFKLHTFDPEAKPEVANTNGALLGIVGADVAGLIQMEQQPFAAIDANNDISELRITYQSGTIGLNLIGLLGKLLGFNGTSFVYNSDLADKFGFNIEVKDLTGLSLLGSDNMKITITPKHGVLNNLLLNEFLATVYSSKDLTQLNLLDSLILDAKDARGGEHSENLAQLLGLGLLSNLLGSSKVPDYIHFVSANSSLDLSSKQEGQRVYLFTGNNSVTLGEGNNIIRGGDGEDSISVGNGDNLIEGGAGSTSLNTGTGVNTLEFRLLDKDDATGGNGLVTWQNFDSDIIDVRDLLPDAAHRNNIEQYLTIDGGKLKIDRQGQGNYTGELVEFDGPAPTLKDLIDNKQLRF